MQDHVFISNYLKIVEQALRYLSILLSQVVHQPNKKGSLRERLHFLAADVTKRYAGTELHCDQQTLSTFKTLRDLVRFFDLYHEQKHQPALETLGKLKLVPLSMNDMEICVHNFKGLVILILNSLDSDALIFP